MQRRRSHCSWSASASAAVEAAGVAVLAALVYANTLSHGFVYDDNRAILSNPDVHSSASSLAQLLLNDYWGTPIRSSSSHGSYRPVAVLSLRLDRWLWGGLRRPGGFHATNVLLHSLATALVLLTARAVLPGAKGAVLAASLFAVHPVHCEAVAGAVGRADILAAIFFLLSFLCFRRHVQLRDRRLLAEEETAVKNKKRNAAHRRSKEAAGFGFGLRDVPAWPKEERTYFGFYVVLAACSLLSKEPGLAVIPLAVCYDVILHLRSTKSYKTKWCSVAGSAFASCLVFALLAFARLSLVGLRTPTFSRADNPAAKDPSPLTRTLTFLYLPLFNLLLLLWPRHLSFDWGMDSIPRVSSVLDFRFFLTVLFYFSLFRLAKYGIRRTERAESKPIPLPKPAACKSCLESSEPHSTSCRLANNNNPPSHCGCLHPLPRPSPSDHPLSRQAAAAVCLAFIVLPFIPASNLFFYVGFVVAERVLYLPSVGFCLLVALGSRSLWPASPSPSACPSRPSSHAVGWLLLIAVMGARTLHRNADWATDEALYRSATHINPPKAWGNLGSVLSTAGRLDEAEAALRTALGHRPNMADVHYNLGNLLSRQNKIEEAVTSHKLAVHFRPSLAVAHLGLGRQYEALAAAPEAEASYRNCWRLRADGLKDPKTHEDARSCCLRRLARLCADANATCRPDTLDILKHVSPSQTSESAHVLGNARLLAANRSSTSEAEELYLRAMRLAPNDPAVYVNYGRLLAGGGRKAEAASAFARAAQLAPEEPALATSAGDALRHAGRLGDAEAAYRRARDLRPREAASHSNLGAIYHLQGKYREAAESYRRALRLAPGDEEVLTNLQRLKRLRMQQTPRSNR